MYYMFNVNVNNKKNSANNFHYCFIPIHYKIRKTNYVSYVNIFFDLNSIFNEIIWK